MAKKTWTQKLHTGEGTAEVFPIPPRMHAKWGTGTMVAPTPLDIDAAIKRIPQGKLATTNELRNAVAKQFGADIACPLVTGISCSISAHAAIETHGDTPWWRALRAGGELNPKFPGDIQVQKALLEAEGHEVVKRGQRYFVVGYSSKLAEI